MGDANMKSMAKGEVLQLERKGYFIVDRPYESGAWLWRAHACVLGTGVSGAALGCSNLRVHEYVVQLLPPALATCPGRRMHRASCAPQATSPSC